MVPWVGLAVRPLGPETMAPCCRAFQTLRSPANGPECRCGCIDAIKLTSVSIRAHASWPDEGDALPKLKVCADHCHAEGDVYRLLQLQLLGSISACGATRAQLRLQVRHEALEEGLEGAGAHVVAAAKRVPQAARGLGDAGDADEEDGLAWLGWVEQEVAKGRALQGNARHLPRKAPAIDAVQPEQRGKRDTSMIGTLSGGCATSARPTLLSRPG